MEANALPAMPATDTTPPFSLGDFLARAEADHAGQPDAALAALLAHAPALTPCADTCRALRLAEHVALAHQADVRPLVAIAAALPAALAGHADTASAVQRLRWVLAVVQQLPDMPDVPPPAVRWHALQNLVLARAWQGRWADAAVLLAADEAAAQAHGSADAGVAYAVSANNVATELHAGGPPGTPRGPERDALMLQAATIARRAWGHAGTWRHVERAEYRLALCHAVAGHGAAAVQHARLCLAGCEAAGDAADAVEHFFAHEALVRAHQAAGDASAAAEARARMVAVLPQIDAADGLRAWCADALAALPG